MRLATIALAPLALAALAACSGNPPPAAPTPQPAPASPAPRPAPAPVAAPAPAPAPAPAAPTAAAARNSLPGEWEWSAAMGAESYSGTMTISLGTTGYAGTLRVAGMFDATLRTASVSGTTVRMVFDSPEGELALEAEFTDPNTLSGNVIVVSAGMTASLSARRR